MKISILITIFILIFVVTAFPQADNKKTNNITSEKSQITFSETEYDFGTIKSGDDAKHYFVFSNTGNTPLVILNVRASCGCMASEWPKAPVGYGMKDSLKIEYNTKIKGTFNKTISVQSNAVNEIYELRIKGTVIKAK
jgi:hypothetical protein